MKTRVSFWFLVLTISINYNLAKAQNSYLALTNLTTLHLHYNSPMDNRDVEEMKYNEFECAVVWENSNIYRKPILVNGKTWDHNDLFFGTKGNMTLVKGRPQTPEAEAIPFYVSIRSNGVILKNKKMPFAGKQLYKLDLSDLYPFCKNGDFIILKPARKADWKAKRLLKVVEGC